MKHERQHNFTRTINKEVKMSLFSVVEHAMSLGYSVRFGKTALGHVEVTLRSESREFAVKTTDMFKQGAVLSITQILPNRGDHMNEEKICHLINFCIAKLNEAKYNDKGKKVIEDSKVIS